MSYKFLEGITVADVAFEATAPTLEKLFADAGIAVVATQINNVNTIKAKVKKKIKIKAENIEELLFKFLDELIFIKDKDLLLFSKFTDMKISKDGSSLDCTAHGEKLDVKRHQTLVDVKAVTMHLFEVKKQAGKWRARVVLDV